MTAAFGATLPEWGALMRLARRASHLAFDDAKAAKRVTNPMDAAMLIYTDDPCAAAALARCADLAEICGVSQIEGVACVAGGEFPPEAREAGLTDVDMPRVAAMFFAAAGAPCPRCRKRYAGLTEGLCGRCSMVETVQ